MFPHVFAVLQLTLLIFGVMPFANSPIIAAGKVDHALKVIMPFHVWVLVFSIILFGLFYRIRRGGIEEKCITVISLVAAMFSALNFVLHLIDNHLLWLWATENVAIALYLAPPIVAFYKISSVLLLLLTRGFHKSRQHQNR